MLTRLVGVLGLALFTCSGPSTEVPANEIQQAVVDDAASYADACPELNDLTALAWSWSQLCWHRDAPELQRGRAALERCRSQSVERGLTAAGDIPAGLELGAPFELANNCPANPPTDEAQLQLYSDIHYAVEDGAEIEVVLTNFCPETIHYGFSPTADDKPPLTKDLPPMTRRKLKVPRGYGLRGRPAYAESWAPGMCKVGRKGMHVTFNADCNSCTAGMIDPLRKSDCVEAGSCPPVGFGR